MVEILRYPTEFVAGLGSFAVGLVGTDYAAAQVGNLLTPNRHLLSLADLQTIWTSHSTPLPEGLAVILGLIPALYIGVGLGGLAWGSLEEVFDNRMYKRREKKEARRLAKLQRTK